MLELKIDTNLGQFVKSYSQFTKKILPKERACLNEKMIVSGRYSASEAARKKANIVKPERFIHGEVTRRGVEFLIADATVGPTVGRGEQSSDRSAQLLSLAATGGRVNFGRVGARLDGMWIINDKRFSLAGAFNRLNETRANGARQTKGAKTIWFARGWMVVVSPKGTALWRRNKQTVGGRPVLWIPARMTFMKKFDFKDEVIAGINANLDQDAADCFSDNTAKHFAAFRKK